MSFANPDLRLLATSRVLPSFVRANVVDEVVIALPLSSCYAEASRIVALCEEQGIVTHCLSNLFDLKLTGAKAEPLDYDSLITFRAGGLQGWGIMFKRFLDIVISLSSLILLSASASDHIRAYQIHFAGAGSFRSEETGPEQTIHRRL